MIYKDPNFKHKYVLDDSSTQQDWQSIIKSYGKDLRCVIANSKTAKIFSGNITINNHIDDNVVFINFTF